jgi:hypothetical protein
MEDISGQYSKKGKGDHYSCNLDDWFEAIKLVLDDLKAKQR